MIKPEITKKEFDEWTSEVEISFVAVTIVRNHERKRLRFVVSLDGHLKVTLGNEILYHGKDFKQAVSVYNEV